MFINTRTKHASNDGIELAVFEAFGEVLVEALSFGLGSQNWSSFIAHSTAHQRALLRSHRGLRHVQTNTQSRKRNKSFIIELESEIIKMWSSE